MMQAVGLDLYFYEAHKSVVALRLHFTALTMKNNPQLFRRFFDVVSVEYFSHAHFGKAVVSGILVLIPMLNTNASMRYAGQS